MCVFRSDKDLSRRHILSRHRLTCEVALLYDWEGRTGAMVRRSILCAFGRNDNGWGQDDCCRWTSCPLNVCPFICHWMNHVAWSERQDECRIPQLLLIHRKLLGSMCEEWIVYEDPICCLQKGERRSKWESSSSTHHFTVRFNFWFHGKRKVHRLPPPQECAYQPYFRQGQCCKHPWSTCSRATWVSCQQRIAASR